ncbi:MAG: hypothetical protein LH624_02360, partial [Cryobacterium sp.]|nr:hypothetical protein [Cryobacterium sp.]
MTKNASLPQSPRKHRVSGLRRATISLLTVLAIVVSGLVSAPPAYAGTDDYPAVWRNAPIDSMFDTWRMYNR